MKRLRTDALPLHDPDVLPAGPSHHLLHVLRGRPGAALVLFDGTGREQDATLIGARDGRAEVRPTSGVREVGGHAEVHLVLALLKHQAMDLALRMAVEAGVHTVHPVITARSVAKGERSDRWARILTAAAAQCGRADEPRIAPVLPLADAVRTLEMPVFVGVPGAAPPDRPTGPCAIVVGPEGGLTSSEVDRLIAGGAHPVGLGPHVLRAETAAAVGVALLWPGAPAPPSAG